jgi:hypothetical protein
MKVYCPTGKETFDDEPQEGVADDAATLAELNHWNATQVARGKQQTAAAGASPRNQSLVMLGDEPFVTIEPKQFQLFPANDHTVELSPGAHCYRHAYYWPDLQEVGVAVVDLLQPQEGVVHDADSLTVMELWNAAQVARAKAQVTISGEFQKVLSVCSQEHRAEPSLTGGCYASPCATRPAAKTQYWHSRAGSGGVDAARHSRAAMMCPSTQSSEPL